MKDLLNTGQALGRSEMKKIMAGSGDSFTRCECYNIEGGMEGTVLCTGLEYNTCCQLQYSETFAANCSSA